MGTFDDLFWDIDDLKNAKYCGICGRKCRSENTLPAILVDPKSGKKTNLCVCKKHFQEKEFYELKKKLAMSYEDKRQARKNTCDTTTSYL